MNLGSPYKGDQAMSLSYKTLDLIYDASYIRFIISRCMREEEKIFGKSQHARIYLYFYFILNNAKLMPIYFSKTIKFFAVCTMECFFSKKRKRKS
mgnify:CR=1 FL=1